MGMAVTAFYLFPDQVGIGKGQKLVSNDAVQSNHIHLTDVCIAG